MPPEPEKPGGMRRLAIILACALSIQPAAAALKKCVDGSGTTQYYDKTPPPECQGKAIVEMNDHGVVTKRTEAAGGQLSAAQQTERRLQEQKLKDDRRRDSALLNTYTDEKEIDLARERNLQPVELAISGIEPRLKIAQSRLDHLRKQATETEKSNHPALASIREDVVSAEREAKHLQDELTGKRREAEQIRARFDADKKRFRELKQDPR